MQKRYLLRATGPPPHLISTALLLLLLRPCSAYDPTDKIFINCGSTDASDGQGRHWTSDDDPKYSLLDSQKTLTATAAGQPSSAPQALYTTARLSRSEFSYSFPVMPGPKFVRLHFFPSDYSHNFSRSDALFSVNSTGRYILLRNFSTSLVADYLDEPTFFREFCVVVEDNQRLNLTFTPSTDSPNAYALINGIEIVSMPSDLYYSNSTRDDSSREPVFLSSNRNPLTLSYSHALETVYRINVGGSDIAPGRDTGMLRNWIQDDAYLTEDVSSVLPVNESITLTFDKIPEYAAPGDVYRTARSMGTDRKINLSYNLTWSFPVDSNFIYIVRLHFCEFQREISKIGDRVFEIYVASLEANPIADVIRWTGGRGIPIYKDYAVNILPEGSAKINLTVSLHTAPEIYSVYADALLNGIEVFKISNGDGNLAGPNPDPIKKTQNLPLLQPSSESRGKTKKLIAAIAGGGVSGALVLVLMFFLFYRKGSSSKDSICTDETSLWGPLPYMTTKLTKTHNSSLPAHLCRHFSLAEIMAATNGFDEIFIIGVGGFGNVYKGYVDGGSTPVAIKRLNPGSQQGACEFMTEIEMLSQLRHLHLVSLIGYCNDGGEMILVYDYMSHGTLREHLYNTKNSPLPWKQRLEICIGAAKGIQYLHSGMKNMIIHRDMKTTNILLDDKWVAKVSDFGLSKIGPMADSNGHVTTVVKGTFGYCDPEYYCCQRLTEKSDVYSFGVVLLEVLCARPPVNRTVEKKQISLASWAQSCYRNGMLGKIVDQNLRGQIAPECLKKFGELAMSCLQDEGTQRPSMKEVVWGLELALQLQESTEEVMEPGATLARNSVEEEAGLLKWTSDSRSDIGVSDIGVFTASSSDSTGAVMMTTTSSSTITDSENLIASRAVFSEIRNPQGR